MQNKDQMLWDCYLSAEPDLRLIEITDDLDEIPKSDINKILDFLGKEKFELNKFHRMILPICLEYGLEQQTFHEWLQFRANRL